MLLAELDARRRARAVLVLALRRTAAVLLLCRPRADLSAVSSLVPTGTGFLTTRADRATSRAIERIHARQAVVTALEIAKTEVIQDVGASALTAAAHLASLETLLAQQAPTHAHGRLMAIGDAAAVGLSDIVIKCARTMR